MIKIVSYTTRLKQNLQNIEDKMMEFLDASSIKKFSNEYDSPIFIVGRSYYWAEIDESQKLLQMQLIKEYKNWIEHFRLLFSNVSQEVRKQIDEVHKFVTSWIEKESSWDIPSTIQDAKSIFKENLRVFHDLIDLYEKPGKNELVLVPDTNALISVPDVSKYSISAGQTQYTVVIIPTVLEELDKLKVIHRDQEFRDKVDSVIKRIKGLRNQGSLSAGVTVNKSVTVKMVASEPNFNKTLHWLDSTNNDDRIVASTLELQREHPSDAVILVTSDINLQNKVEMANLPYIEPPNP